MEYQRQLKRTRLCRPYLKRNISPIAVEEIISPIGVVWALVMRMVDPIEERDRPSTNQPDVTAE